MNKIIAAIIAIIGLAVVAYALKRMPEVAVKTPLPEIDWENVVDDPNTTPHYKIT